MLTGSAIASGCAPGPMADEEDPLAEVNPWPGRVESLKGRGVSR